MAKVKKTAAVTGVRNVKASKKAGKKGTTVGTGSRKASPTKAVERKASTRAATPAKAGKPAKAKSSRTRKSTTTTGSKSMSRVKSIGKARSKAQQGRVQAPTPVVRVAVKPLEPQAKCGAGTSVQYLFRVDETVDGRTTAHLVFYDRHGWYCEHGRNCPAVGHAKKYQGHMARAS